MIYDFGLVHKQLAPVGGCHTSITAPNTQCFMSAPSSVGAWGYASEMLLTEYLSGGGALLTLSCIGGCPWMSRYWLWPGMVLNQLQLVRQLRPFLRK